MNTAPKRAGTSAGLLLLLLLCGANGARNDPTEKLLDGVAQSANATATRDCLMADCTSWRDRL